MRHILISLFLFSTIAADLFLFTPPKEWKQVPASTKNAFHVVTFVAPKSQFPPSLSVAKEKLTVSQSQFLGAVEHHLKESSHKFIRLGKIAGAHPHTLYQVDKQTKHGTFTLLTAVLFHKEDVFTLSFASKSDSFPMESQTFRNTLKTVRFPKNFESVKPNGFSQLSQEITKILQSLPKDPAKFSPAEKTKLSEYEKRARNLVPENETFFQHVVLQELFKKT